MIEFNKFILENYFKVKCQVKLVNQYQVKPVNSDAVVQFSDAIQMHLKVIIIKKNLMM